MNSNNKRERVFRVALKYPEDILEPDWGFTATSQQEADKLVDGWNRYHSHVNAPGYGYAIAKEAAPGEVLSLHDEWVQNYR